MSKTRAQIASAGLRNIQLPEDTSTPAVQALADAKLFHDERCRKIWQLKHWPEFVILGSFSVPIGTFRVALSDIVVDSSFTAGGGYAASFDKIVAVREGINPLLPEDMGAINLVQADAWASTTAPVRFVSAGQSGIRLLGSYTVATTLSFFGKAAIGTIADSASFILDCEDALIAGITSDLMRISERDSARAMEFEQIFENEVRKMINARESQAANIKRIIPLSPWTAGFGYNTGADISKTGGGPYY